MDQHIGKLVHNLDKPTLARLNEDDDDQFSLKDLSLSQIFYTQLFGVHSKGVLDLPLPLWSKCFIPKQEYDLEAVINTCTTCAYEGYIQASTEEENLGRDDAAEAAKKWLLESLPQAAKRDGKLKDKPSRGSTGNSDMLSGLSLLGKRGKSGHMVLGYRYATKWLVERSEGGPLAWSSFVAGHLEGDGWNIEAPEWSEWVPKHLTGPTS